ncbi:MAG TPA: ferritin-like domain-containing protein [Patescibacteria group bacterium]|nr:ferritin-like domain-containing protein [Patescibacteria group bacterium]
MANIILPGEDRGLNRRSFFKVAGFGAAAIAAMTVAGCEDDDNNVVTPANTIDLGSGNTGVLNYAYALEQLEAAFYEKVVATGTATGLSTEEMALFTDIKNHEVIHREFFLKALGTTNAKTLTAAQVNFSSINFNNRQSILNTAMAFEDLGVSAYNGAGKYLSDPNLLLAAGKIVSVEARHAAIIRDLMVPRSNAAGSFAGDDVVTVSQGLDVVREPSAVLAIANNYLNVKLTANNIK